MDNLFDHIFQAAKFITFPDAPCVPRKPLSQEQLDAQFNPRLDLAGDLDAYYTGYFPNEHHIKTTYIWEHYMDPIFSFLEIPFDKTQFELHPYYDESGKYDLSFHDPIDKSNTSFTYFDINMYRTAGTFDILRLVELEKTGFRNPLSRYHNLFYGYHSNARIYNNNPTTDIKMLVVCDSMMIPIIPVLAYYCKELTVVDNRERKPWLSKLTDHDYNKVLISRILCDFTLPDIRFRFH